MGEVGTKDPLGLLEWTSARNPSWFPLGGPAPWRVFGSHGVRKWCWKNLQLLDKVAVRLPCQRESPRVHGPIFVAFGAQYQGHWSLVPRTMQITFGRRPCQNELTHVDLCSKC